MFNLLWCVMEKMCAICEATIGSGFKNNWYCGKCYNKYKKEIFANEGWVIFLRNCERKRRRRKEPPTIYLGDKWDIGPEGKLVLGDYDG